MNAEKWIFDKYSALGIAYGGELLLRRSEALEFIEDCRRLGLMILGMDFWVQRDDEFIQTLGSADYSEVSGEPDAIERTTRAARELIKDGLPDRADRVSFVVEELRKKLSGERNGSRC